MTDKVTNGALITATVVALLLAACAARAADQGPRRQAWYDDAKVQQALELTADQVASLAEVEASFGTRLAELNAQKRTAYRKLLTSLDPGNLPADEFQRLRGQLEAAYGTHAAVSADRWQALRSVLTESQWRKLPEAAPKALALGNYSVAKRGGIFLGPRSGQGPAPSKK
jgi:hypothetical protein